MQNLETILKDYQAPELIGAMLQYIDNRQKNDKGSIAYKVGMIDHWQGLRAQGLKRADVIALFTSLLNKRTIYQVIKSEYTATQLLNYLPKIK